MVGLFRFLIALHFSQGLLELNIALELENRGLVRSVLTANATDTESLRIAAVRTLPPVARGPRGRAESPTAARSSPAAALAAP